jgi:hypothetical protein
MRRLVVGLLGLMLVVAMALTTTTAYAVKEFKEQFEAKYAKPHGRKRPNPNLVRAVAAAQCRICHPGDDKHKLNVYGAQLGQYVNHFDKDKTERIQDALEKISVRRRDPFDPKSPTFGELIKKGELPVDTE